MFVWFIVNMQWIEHFSNCFMFAWFIVKMQWIKWFVT